ncbi:aromatic ring-hydroxylating dioxygenase subunit alpha [Prodigiosinella confusarubida]|uniref:Aromatic ring-hydroxylating dioxygenase subunit alpha n=1 Tax=Serratia sp. (strain ATCC 39006) TaxID=104623 RepID=A0A2I5T4Q3_SERS3|nr:aromatic ring-hydroxylating dioxygenase subunit alpha [Serratia sp. ATCC 39006]AUG99550.1 aromatic ring-hydroxylating dioxygenase subunit alpha [Serratia sp. ATCC 39006]AUH03868.1 aromatic ring-hydroxylating dioxygenase subunit alpha [Serratia sp. ATCC 39006]
MKVTLNPPANCSFASDDWYRLARYWHPVALAAEVGPAPMSVTLLDEPLVVYRAGDDIVAARDICPHRGVPLSMGSSDGQGIVCPYHGLRFGEGGRCNRVPASPDLPIPPKLNLLTFAAREQYGLVWVCMDPPDGILPALPLMPHWDDDGFQQIVCPSFHIAGFAGRQIEGFLDVAHFAWVHTDTFADPNNQQVPDYQTLETPYGFNADYVSSMSNFAHGSGCQAPEGFTWLRHFEMHLPFTATLTIHFPDEGRLVIMNAASPVSARKTCLFVPIARNFDLHIPLEEVHAFNRRVFEEDRVMVESQRPEHLPLDLTLEAHIPADRSSIAYRRGLKRLGFGAFFLV